MRQRIPRGVHDPALAGNQGCRRSGDYAAGFQKLEELAQARERRAQLAKAGDTETTVGDLVDRVPATPAVMKLAPRTREGHHYI